MTAPCNYMHIYCKSNKHEPVSQWCWCWKSICIALTKYKGYQFSSLLLRKITFPKSTVPFSHLPVTSQEGLSQSAGLCMQIDPDGHGVQTSSPPHTLWLNLTPRTTDGRGGPFTFAEPPNLNTITHSTADHRLSGLSSMNNYSRLNSGRFPSSYHHR